MAATQIAPTFDTSHSGPIHDAQLDYYGKLLASSSSDHTIHIWDVSSDVPKFVSELRGHEGPVWQVSWAHPKYGNLLASCSYDRRVIIWREQPMSSWNPVYVTEEHSASVDAIQFAPWELGLHLACGSSDGTVSVLSYIAETGTWSREVFNAHPNGVLSLSWCPAAVATTSVVSGSSSSNPIPQTVAMRRIVTGGCDHQVRVWSLMDATNKWILAHQMSDNITSSTMDSNNRSEQQQHSRWVRDVAWRPNPGLSPNLIASCSDDGTVILWQENENHSWKNKQVIRLNEPVWKLSWSVTGAVLSVASGTDTVSLFKENLQGIWEPLSAASEVMSSLEMNTSTNNQLQSSGGVIETSSQGGNPPLLGDYSSISGERPSVTDQERLTTLYGSHMTTTNMSQGIQSSGTGCQFQQPPLQQPSQAVSVTPSGSHQIPSLYRSQQQHFVGYQQLQQPHQQSNHAQISSQMMHSHQQLEHPPHSIHNPSTHSQSYSGYETHQSVNQRANINCPTERLQSGAY